MLKKMQRNMKKKNCLNLQKGRQSANVPQKDAVEYFVGKVTEERVFEAHFGLNEVY